MMLFSCFLALMLDVKFIICYKLALGNPLLRVEYHYNSLDPYYIYY
jgi:hypothetical protein